MEPLVSAKKLYDGIRWKENGIQPKNRKFEEESSWEGMWPNNFYKIYESLILLSISFEINYVFI